VASSVASSSSSAAAKAMGETRGEREKGEEREREKFSVPLRSLAPADSPSLTLTDESKGVDVFLNKVANAAFYVPSAFHDHSLTMLNICFKDAE